MSFDKKGEPLSADFFGKSEGSLELFRFFAVHNLLIPAKLSLQLAKMLRMLKMLKPVVVIRVSTWECNSF